MESHRKVVNYEHKRNKKEDFLGFFLVGARNVLGTLLFPGVALIARQVRRAINKASSA